MCLWSPSRTSPPKMATTLFRGFFESDWGNLLLQNLCIFEAIFFLKINIFHFMRVNRHILANSLKIFAIDLSKEETLFFRSSCNDSTPWINYYTASERLSLSIVFAYLCRSDKIYIKIKNAQFLMNPSIISTTYKTDSQLLLLEAVASNEQHLLVLWMQTERKQSLHRAQLTSDTSSESECRNTQSVQFFRSLKELLSISETETIICVAVKVCFTVIYDDHFVSRHHILWFHELYTWKLWETNRGIGKKR